MKNEVLAAVLVTLIILSAGAGYLVGVSNQRTVTSVSTSMVTSVSTTTAPGASTTSTAMVPSLQLVATVRPAIAAVGQNITIGAEVFNPLPTVVTASANEMTNPSQNPCGLGIIPTGIRVYSGHYVFANLSTGEPLLLYNASGPPPPCVPPYDNIVYTFLPNTDNATMSYPGASINWVTNETITVNGYWTPSLLAGPGNFYNLSEFSAGTYTVLVFDAWGQQMVMYFQIT